MKKGSSFIRMLLICVYGEPVQASIPATIKLTHGASAAANPPVVREALTPGAQGTADALASVAQRGPLHLVGTDLTLSAQPKLGGIV
jgi:hypothetical protein